MPAAFRLPLQVFFEREARHPRQTFLVQPAGATEVQTLTTPAAPHNGAQFQAWSERSEAVVWQD